MGPLPDYTGVFAALFVFAAVGLVALLGGGIWAIIWLIENISVVVK